MAKKNQIEVVRNGKTILYDVVSKDAYFAANKQIEAKMKPVIIANQSNSAGSKRSVNKLVLNA